MEGQRTLSTIECPDCGDEASEVNVMFQSTVHVETELTIRGIDTSVWSAQQIVHVRLDCPGCPGFVTIIKDIPLN